MPVVAHIHVPKTAGTSLVCLLQRAGKSHVNLYVNDTHFTYSERTLTEEVLSDLSIKSLSSHYILTFPPYLGGRRILYFSLLRNPVEQFISYLTFIKKVFKTITDPNLLTCLPPDPTSLSLREFARWLLTGNRDEMPFHENYAVNFLARQTYLKLNGGLARFDRHAYRAVRLSLAKAVLDQFVYVGLFERLTESIDELREVLNYLGAEIPNDPIGCENTSSELRDDLSWTDPGDEVGAMLHKSLEEDKALYSWGVERFESHCWIKRFGEMAASE